VDELGFEREVAAVQTIAQRGVQFIATCHGFTLASVVANPVLAPLLGRIEYTVRQSGRRPEGMGLLMGEASATFQRAVEVQRRGEFVVHDQLGQAVRAILDGKAPQGRMVRAEDGKQERPSAAQGGRAVQSAGGGAKRA
jgi:hypothetical protein